MTNDQIGDLMISMADAIKTMAEIMTDLSARIQELEQR